MATGGVATGQYALTGPAPVAAIWVSNTPGTDTAADVRCLSDGTVSRPPVRVPIAAAQKPIRRTTISSSVTGSSNSSASPTNANSVSYPGGRHQLFGFQ